MAASLGFGFREVLVDQPYAGKWIEVDMNIMGGHTTFQGTKFSDAAGGYSYKTGPSPRNIMQNRSIYWRTLNDTLELTEVSLDYNLHDNQVRYIFRDSPIVGPISIHETDISVIILVATVTSINRFVFTHPKCFAGDDGKFMKNNNPSIFFQVMNKPSMTFRSFNLHDNAINVPIPTSAASFYVPNTSDSVFALSYESGSITVYKISREEILTSHDLLQPNFLTRILSGFTTSLLRSSTVHSDAITNLTFFITKLERNRNALFLVTLSMKGHLQLWMCNNLHVFTDWCSHSNGIVHQRFLTGEISESNMLIRRTWDKGSNELPLFVVFVPGEGFKLFQVEKNAGTAQGTPPLFLRESLSIDFRGSDIMDFTVTSEYLFALVTNPEEETEWEVKSYKLNETLSPRFNLALLEPLPIILEPSVNIFPPTADPKDFFFDLIFSKSSFSASTICKALSMFQSGQHYPVIETDWEKLKIYAMNVVDREIGIRTSTTDFDLADEVYHDLNLEYWLMFYNSCVEYHIHTVKPLGLFFDFSTKMVCIVKKSRISFLRPTDLLETLYYFPNCIPIPDNVECADDRSYQLSLIVRYLEVLDIIESTATEFHKEKINRRLITNILSLEDVCSEVATMLTETDPLSMLLEQRHFISLLSSKLRDLGENGDTSMTLALSLILSWDRDEDIVDFGIMDEEDHLPVTDFFLGSRFGANLAYRVLKQMWEHRFMLARNTMLLQALVVKYFNQNNEAEGIHMSTTWNDRREAAAATTYHHSLLRFAERNAESVPDSILDKGLKIANILKSNTSDHMIHGKLNDVWPMTLVEMFCASRMGGLAIRKRVSRSKKSGIVGYAEAAGKAIWPNDLTSLEHPFEEFLISACQYTALLHYGQDMLIYLVNTKRTLKKFYLGLAHLCSGNDDTALGHFRSISMREAWDDPYFCVKMLDFPLPSQTIAEMPNTCHSTYYAKVINLFQIYDDTRAVQILAQDALKVCDDEDSITRMCSLAFKCALQMDDYDSAYKFILRMPSYEIGNTFQDRSQKLASLRLLIGKIIQQGDVEVLINLNFNSMFNKSSTFREQVEDILFTQANLSDPVLKDGIYQILYLYHLTRQNFHKAAAALYSRIIRIGEKGVGVQALIEQKESYLDVLTCLSLVEDENFRWVLRKTGLETELPEDVLCIDGSKVPALCYDKEIEVISYKEIRKEMELCVAAVKLSSKVDAQPIRIREFKSRAESLLQNLIAFHFYDDAIKIATLWELPYTSVISAFAATCTKMVYQISPDTEDPFDYIRHNDTSELPNSNANVTELGFRLLCHYVWKLEKQKESCLHEAALLKLLEFNVPPPQWLLESYKRQNTAELILCYIRFGYWEEATVLSIRIIDASLGRRSLNEFDSSIKVISAYENANHYIPFSIIDQLTVQLENLFEEGPQFMKLYDSLKDKCDLYIERVKETLREKREGVQISLQ